MKYGKHLTTAKAIDIVQNMNKWKDKNKDKQNVPPQDYTSYAAALQLLKDKGIYLY